MFQVYGFGKYNTDLQKEFGWYCQSVNVPKSNTEQYMLPFPWSVK